MPNHTNSIAVTVTVHKTIASNAPDDELSSPRNMSASMHWCCADPASDHRWGSFAWCYAASFRDPSL